MPTVDLGLVKGDTGAQGATGARGSRGSRWTSGTAITGTAKTGTVFASSGITDALVGDMYLNQTTGCVYSCTLAGVASVAKWAYVQQITPTFSVDGNGHLIATYL
jgi:hypothetical protein